MFEHIWYTPADIASQLEARQHGSSWRAKCPAHGGDNPQSLLIKEGTDKHGHPCTILKCFAHDCDIRDICTALGIELRQLFCIHPDYAKATKHAPRAKGPGIKKLETLDAPVAAEIAQCLLAEIVIEDPSFLEAKGPRKAIWDWGSTSLEAKALFTEALTQAGYIPTTVWKQLAHEYGGADV